MKEKQHIKGEGIVLRRIALNEADQIITVLSPQLGRVGLLAKGSRKMRSKFCGQLESLSQIRFSAFAGKDLLYLDEAELACPRNLMESDLKNKSILFFIAEITGKLVPEAQESEGVYRLLGQTLDQFARQVSEPSVAPKGDLLLYGYLIKLLTELGFMAEWDHCSKSGERLDLGDPLFLSMENASVVKSGYQTASDPRLTTSLIKWVNFMQKNDIGELVKVCPSPGEERQVWFVIQCLFQGLFSTPLKSEKFLSLVRL